MKERLTVKRRAGKDVARLKKTQRGTGRGCGRKSIDMLWCLKGERSR